MFQTTRRRLALWYAAVTAVLMLLFASGVYGYVRSTLIERVDDTLSHIVEVVERSLIIEPQAEGLVWSVDGQPDLHVNVEASFRSNGADRDDDRIEIEWFSPDGKLLWSTFETPIEIPLRTESRFSNKNGETVTVAEQRYGEPVVLRQLTDCVVQGRQTLGYLRVSHPWFEVSKPTRRLILDLSIGLALITSGVSTIGWLLSGLAMEPVRASYQSLKQFTADASHELRNPIAMIQTNVQAALVDPQLDQHQAQQLQVVERLTRRLGKLVDDLLFLARQDGGMVKPQRLSVALDEVLTEVLEEQLIKALEKRVSLELEFEDSGISEPLPDSISELEPTFELLGDRDQLARLFTNLISNAVQYTPPDGDVQVRLSRASDSQTRGKPILAVHIQDSGMGIPAEALEHLFERFYRVDPARSRQTEGGSGLGLAIAKAIVEQHQGQIQITSQEQQGTAVLVTLPAQV